MSVCMHEEARYRRQNLNNIVKGLLTDRKIEAYQKRGWYSESFKEERRKFQEKKRAFKRMGNWLESDDGRSIYSPL